MMKFNENLKKIRKEKGMTQNQLAEKAGFDQSHISHFECGRREPNLKNLVILANALDCIIDDLVR